RSKAAPVNERANSMKLDHGTALDEHVDVGAAPHVSPRLHVDDATIGYDKRVISENLSVSIPNESFTVIVGPNACGKSTLLRAMSRLLKPSAGHVVLDGKSIMAYKAKEVSRRLGLLPQTSIAPDGI